MKNYLWALGLIWLLAVLIGFVLLNVPLIHECPVLQASMLEAQPIMGCLI